MRKKEVASMNEEAPVVLTTETEWARSGNAFISRSRADMTEKLPSGVYGFVPTMNGWYLERTADRFEFPFKVYPVSDNIINRITTFWEINGGSLGVLMNGLKGSGKTMAAQLLANKLIEGRELPVLVVRKPIGLQLVFDAVKQDMMVIFDEFEKTHDEEESPGCQQELLSTIDGMSRSSYNRLIIFTTNSSNINENFQDRPSRIHYKFEFYRVADGVIDGLIEDTLPKDLLHFRDDIIEYLQTRKICTIDIVKAVINEVKTFGESPIKFEDVLNIAKGDPPSYSIEIINPDSGVATLFCSNFMPEDAARRSIELLSGRFKPGEDRFDSKEIYSDSYDGRFTINLLEKCEEKNCWLAHIAVPISKTHFNGFGFYEEDRLYLDTKPKDWSFSYTPKQVDNNEEKMDKLHELFGSSRSTKTLYGTGERIVFKIRISPNTAVTRWKPTGKSIELFQGE